MAAKRRRSSKELREALDRLAKSMAEERDRNAALVAKRVATISSRSLSRGIR